MREFARFAVSFLSAVALPLFAADVREAKAPAEIASAFPKSAKVRMLNVWATWCLPCVAEMPDLREIDEAFGSELAIAGLSLDDMIPDTKPEKVQRFLDMHKIAFPNLYYTGKTEALAEHLNIDGEIPVTIFYDRDGKELWRTLGRLDKKQTVARLRETLRRIR